MSGTDEYGWDKVVEAVSPIAPAVKELTAQIKATVATSHDSRSLALSPLVPTIVMGYDPLRTRALVRATVEEVYIGTLATLQSGYGYPAPVASGDEIKSTNEVYALYAPTGAPDPLARISVWVERNA